jgi:hypothetical protein
VKTQFTPGPWRTTGLNVRAGDALICFATDHWYAEDDGFYAFTDLAEKQANATLIASAPELLSALKRLTDCLSEDPNDYPDSSSARQVLDSIRSAREIITKIGGAK